MAPLRKVGRDWIRDPYRPGTRDYVAHPDAVKRILSWYQGDRAEYPGRDPDGWTEYREEREGDRVRILLRARANDACVEVTYTLADGTELWHEARALPPEEAYRIALEVDEWRRDRGERIYNERHPRPEPPEAA